MLSEKHPSELPEPGDVYAPKENLPVQERGENLKESLIAKASQRFKNFIERLVALVSLLKKAESNGSENSSANGTAERIRLEGDMLYEKFVGRLPTTTEGGWRGGPSPHQMIATEIALSANRPDVRVQLKDQLADQERQLGVVNAKINRTEDALKKHRRDLQSTNV